jgi:hypothetical protein
MLEWAAFPVARGVLAEVHQYMLSGEILNVARVPEQQVLCIKYYRTCAQRIATNF